MATFDNPATSLEAGQNGTRFCRQRNEWLTDRRKAAICELLAPARALPLLIRRLVQRLNRPLDSDLRQSLDRQQDVLGVSNCL